MTHNMCALMRAGLTGIAAGVMGSEQHRVAGINAIIADRHGHCLMSTIRASKLAISHSGSKQPGWDLGGLFKGDTKAR